MTTAPTFYTSEQVREAYAALIRLTEDKLATVATWFCPHCWRYVGPEGHCHCRRDE